jgi:glycosyltransferase involved in cell wall biosynthesis
MRFVLIADTFPPLRNSGAVQLRDLSREFINQGHQITVILPSAEIKNSWALEESSGVQVLRLRAPIYKDVSYIRRTFAEFLMPFYMLRNLRKSPLAKERWCGIIWYSPSIFHGPFIRSIKRVSKCNSYLILRDIFPQWAVDMGLIKRGSVVHFFFNTVARYQYSVANTIGVQALGNLDYFKDWVAIKNRKLEVLQNWLSDIQAGKCSISLSETKLVGRRIFVYAGNMGVAQGVGIFLDLAELLQKRMDIGFLFVGRGSDAQKLAEDASSRGLNNVLFYDEIHPDEISGLYAQCAVGLVALDLKHKSHNIPGKFLTYMQAGLPVLARINSGNDLVEIIKKNNVGRVIVSNDYKCIEGLANDLLILLDADNGIKDRCRNLYNNLFSPKKAVNQIIDALRGGSAST